MSNGYVRTSLGGRKSHDTRMVRDKRQALVSMNVQHGVCALERISLFLPSMTVCFLKFNHVGQWWRDYGVEGGDVVCNNVTESRITNRSSHV